MSAYIEIHQWSGFDPAATARSLARIFKLDPRDAAGVVRKLIAGQTWRFEHPVEKRQAGQAARYLESLGFGVRLLPAAPVVSHKFDFQGGGGELFGISLVNSLLTLCTLGVYRFWAKTRVRQYLYGQTVFAGKRFSYEGTGGELFKGFLKFLAILLILGLAGELVSAFAGPAVGEIFNAFVPFAILSLIPLFMLGAWRYRLSRAVWRGVRFGFRGVGIEILWLYLRGWFLTIGTLGLYLPVFNMEKRRFGRANSSFGNLPFEFSGKAKDIYGRFLLALVLVPSTLGLYWVWYKAYLQQYVWSHTRIGENHFRFTATGGQILGLYVGNLLLLALTFGLAFPWVAIRNQRFLAENLRLEGEMKLDTAVQSIKKSGALGEEVVDSFDISMGVFE
ncbi:MAG: YjgN family protein [Nitrospinales bacterium]